MRFGSKAARAAAIPAVAKTWSRSMATLQAQDKDSGFMKSSLEDLIKTLTDKYQIPEN